MPYYGARLRAARSYAAMTQEQLAERLGVDPATVKRRELPRGHENLKTPKKGERLAIASICGVPPEFMEEGFGGHAADEISERLAALEDVLRDLQRELIVREAEESLRTDEDDQQDGDPPPEPPR